MPKAVRFEVAVALSIERSLPLKLTSMAIKKISVLDLQVGMYIHDFCGAWMDHPFWGSKFTLSSDDEVQPGAPTPALTEPPRAGRGAGADRHRRIQPNRRHRPARGCPGSASKSFLAQSCSRLENQGLA